MLPHKFLFPLAVTLDTYLKGFFQALNWCTLSELEALKKGHAMDLPKGEVWQLSEGDYLHKIPQSEADQFIGHQIQMDIIYDCPLMSDERRVLIVNLIRETMGNAFEVWTNNFHPYPTNRPAYFVSLSPKQPALQVIFLKDTFKGMALGYLFSEESWEEHEFRVEDYGFRPVDKEDLRWRALEIFSQQDEPMTLLNWLAEINTAFENEELDVRTHSMQLLNLFHEEFYPRKMMRFAESNGELIFFRY